MKWKIIISGIILLMIFIAIAVVIFNENLQKILLDIIYWIIITLAIGLFIFIAVTVFPGLKKIF